GLEAEPLLAMAEAPAAIAEFAANTDEAIALGVVGSPTYFAGGEMFFGQDRLDFLDEALTDAMAA
ncbi:MAG: DsbA family protein, partial [Beijerinckiaceae bacterium]|nr:DsbA family protein [Beijerinckiaceae bacterium]